MTLNLEDIFAEIERQGVTITLYGIRYKYFDSEVDEDYLYPVVFTNRDKAQEWLDKHPIMSHCLSVEEIKLNPKPGIM